MKILIYTLNYAPELTGVGKYSAEMAEWLASRGHEVRVLTALPYYPDWQVQPGYSAGGASPCPHSSGPGLTVMRHWLWVPRRPTGIRRILHLLSFALTSLRGLVREMARRPDVAFIVLPTLMIAPQSALLGRWLGVRTWAHVHDFEIDAALNLKVLNMRGASGLLFAAERALLRGFNRVSTISGGMMERLRAKQVPVQHCALFPNWVDMQDIVPPDGPNSVRAELGLGDDDVLVLYAGNMGEKQGLDIVVQAARALAGRPHIRFLMVGEGSSRRQLQAASADLSNVQWWPLQPKERLGELLHAADIHVLPQRAGAADLVMPSKLGPALASSRLVIGTAEAGTELGQVLDIAGHRVPPEDLPALVAAIERAAADPVWRAERGRLGRAHVAAHLDKAVVLARFEQQCAELAGYSLVRAEVVSASDRRQ